jgi:spore maturation protein CgeB
VTRNVSQPLDLVFLGLSITSSWGNGHATTYRALLKELAARGHRVTFLERDLPFYAENRDLAHPPYGQTHLYASLEELHDRFAETVGRADLVVVGSYVPEGKEVGAWVQELAPGRCAFYDIDTPVTLAKLASGDGEYVAPSQISRYALYLSFTGGPTLRHIEEVYGSPCARPLYCSVDPDLYCPTPTEVRYDLGYLGTYSPDRQPAVERLLLEPARTWADGRFKVAGAQYPADLAWPSNVEHEVHLPPARHREFYCSQRYTLNVTREAMVRAGHSPSVRIFEAAACGTPIISDRWPGLETVLAPGKEIFVADTTRDALRILRDVSEAERTALAEAARTRILSEHTAAHRAAELEGYALELLEHRTRRTRVTLDHRVDTTLRGTP